MFHAKRSFHGPNEASRPEDLGIASFRAVARAIGWRDFRHRRCGNLLFYRRRM